MKKKKFTLIIDEDMLKEVKKRAIQEDKKISEWICEAIELCLLYGIEGSLGNEERF